MFVFRFEYWLLSVLVCCLALDVNAETAEQRTVDVSHRVATFAKAQGLDEADVLQIFEDSQGVFWFATKGGLFRFDGEQFLPVPLLRQSDKQKDTKSVSIQVNRIAEDPKQRVLWLGTDQGLRLLDLRKGKLLSTEPHCKGAKKCLSRIFYIDTAGAEVLVAAGEGAYRCSKQSFLCQRFNKVNPEYVTDYYSVAWLRSNVVLAASSLGLELYLIDAQGKANPLKHDFPVIQVNAVSVGSDGRVFLASQKGLFELIIDNAFSVSHRLLSKHHQDIVFSVDVDQSGRVWYAGVRELFYLDKQGKEHAFLPINAAGDKIAVGYWTWVLADSKGAIWFATAGQGVIRLSQQQQTVRHYMTSQFPDLQPVFATLKDRASRLWLGQISAGLLKISHDAFYQPQLKLLSAMPSKHIFALAEYDKTKLFVGTQRGLLLYDFGRETFVTDTEAYAPINALEWESAKTLWACGEQELKRYDLPVTESVSAPSQLEATQKINLNALGFADSYCTAAAILNNNALLLGSLKGLFHFNVSQSSLERIDLPGLLDEGSRINGIFKGQSGFWIAKRDGVVLLDTKLKPQPLTWANLVAGKRIIKVLENQRRIVVVTSETVLVIDKTRSDSVINLAEAMVETTFNIGSVHLSFDNHVLLGSNIGFFEIDLNKLQQEVSRDFALSAFKINDQPWSFGDDDLSRFKAGEISELAVGDALILRLMGVSGLNLHYALNDAPNTLALKNAEVSLSLSEFGKQRLDFIGRYPSNEAQPVKESLRFSVARPWYHSYVAYVVYCLLFVLFNFALFKLRHRYMEKKNALLESLVASRTEAMAEQSEVVVAQAEQLKGLLAAKDELLADVAHELKTPVNLILGPVSAIREQLKDKSLNPLLDVVDVNGARLLRTIEQLIDIEHCQSLPFDNDTTINASNVTRLLIEHFFSVVAAEAIQLDVDIDDDVLLKMSEEHYEKIFSNLLSNAIKYVGGDRIIEVKLHKSGDEARLEVTNSGSSIPDNEQEALFERFYRRPEHKHIQGSGLGLALIKQLAERYGGDVKVTTPKIQHCRFSVSLPLDTQGKQSSEIGMLNKQNLENTVVELKRVRLNQDEEKRQLSPESDGARFKVLIIEDNPTLNDFVSYCFKWEFETLTAMNGREGIELAKQHNPDLIITDLIMPEMDGLAVCEALKNDSDTLHIPIIMVTAHSSIEQQREAMGKQVDAFVAKPFNVKDLLLLAKNTVVQRRHVIQKAVSENMGLMSQQLTPIEALNEEDNKRIEAINECIAENYQDWAFNPDTLAKSVGMSRRTLDRHAKRLIGNSAAEFIKIYRLNQAALKIRSGGSLSNIAFDVGFSSHSHFSRSFKEYFEMTPTEYRSAQQEKNELKQQNS